jgi:hypothetical protein
MPLYHARGYDSMIVAHIAVMVEDHHEKGTNVGARE